MGQSVQLMQHQSASQGHLSAEELFANQYSMIGKSPAMGRAYRDIKEVGPLGVPVLIQGENGTGKRMVAQAIYDTYRKGKEMPLVSVYSGADMSLLAPEHTDSGQRVILVNEIVDMDLGLQARVLSILKEGATIHGRENVESRVIATTTRDLKEALKTAKFNPSLYHRLNEVVIYLPSLSERPEDVPILARHYFDILMRRYDKKVTLTDDAVQFLSDHAWSGNITELINVISRAVMSSNGGTINENFLAGLETQGMARH